MATKPNPTNSNGVYFVTPQNGQTVPSNFDVRVGIRGMEVRPAGEPLPHSGYFSILTNGQPFESGKVVPEDDRHIHFSRGQSNAKISLPPGKHSLTVQLLDGNKKAYGPEWSRTITIIVK